MSSNDPVINISLLIKKLITWYIVIGLLVAMFAYSIDTSENKNEAWPVFILFVLFWPLWLVLYAVFG